MLTEGAISLGSIKKIRRNVVTISLPFNFVGVARFEKVEALKFGKFVQCRLSKLISKHKYEVFLDLDKINLDIPKGDNTIIEPIAITGQILSNEDYGSLVKFSETLNGFTKENRFSKGEFSIFAVVPQKMDKYLKVSEFPKKFEVFNTTNLFVMEPDNSPIWYFRPGSIFAIKASLLHKEKDCFSYSCCFSGMKINIPSIYTTSEINLLSDSKIYFRIIYSDFVNNICIASNSHLNMALNIDKTLIGKVINASILKVTNCGLYLIHSNQIFFVKTSHCMSIKKSKISSKIGDTFSIKIFDFDPFSNFYLASCRTQALNGSITFAYELKIGDFIAGSIKKILKKGLIIKLDSGFHSFCSNDHFGETTSELLLNNVRIGQSFVFRVWNKNDDSVIKLTKKHGFFIDSHAKAIFDPKKLQIGEAILGYAACKLSTGFIFRFFGNIKGFLPNRSLNGYDFLIGQVASVLFAGWNDSKKHLLLAAENNSN